MGDMDRRGVGGNRGPTTRLESVYAKGKEEKGRKRWGWGRALEASPWEGEPPGRKRIGSTKGSDSKG